MRKRPVNFPNIYKKFSEFKLLLLLFDLCIKNAFKCVQTSLVLIGPVVLQVAPRTFTKIL